MSLPDNLYESGGYYTWRDPRTKKKFGLGRDVADAIEQAREANEALAARPRLTDRISHAPTGRSLSDFLPAYRENMAAGKLAARTTMGRKSHLRAIERCTHGSSSPAAS